MLANQKTRSPARIAVPPQPTRTGEGRAGEAQGPVHSGLAAVFSDAPPPPAPATAPAPSVDWEALQPTGLYARLGRPLLDLALVVTTLPLALALSVPIALVNLASFGSLRSIFYRQHRVGRRGRIFRIYKFRTMKEGRKGDFQSWSDGGDGPRVTPFGRFLRNAHLDELPQFLNILKGEMTFIGPRPEMVEIDAWAREHVPGFHRRLALKPGITGYSQVTQGYAGMECRAYARKLAGDEHYRRGISLLLDLSILIRTGAWMLRGRGWHWQRGIPSTQSPGSGEATAP